MSRSLLFAALVIEPAIDRRSDGRLLPVLRGPPTRMTKLAPSRPK